MAVAEKTRGSVQNSENRAFAGQRVKSLYRFDWPSRRTKKPARLAPGGLIENRWCDSYFFGGSIEHMSAMVESLSQFPRRADCSSGLIAPKAELISSFERIVFMESSV